MAPSAGGKSWELTGLALMALGVQFSVMTNSIMKTVTMVPVVQAMQVRFIIQWCFTSSTAAVLRLRGHPVHFFGKPGDRWLLLGRATCFAVSILSLWTALRLMPVGDATTIVYLYPLFCGLLANRFLGEPLGWSFWTQAGICTAGMLMVTGVGFFAAGGSAYDHGVALALLAAVCFAATMCFVRALKDAQTIEIQLFTDTVMAFAAMPTTLVVSGVATDWSGWEVGIFLRLAGATMCGLCALLLVILGTQLAPASKATLFTYLEIPSAFVVQVLAFGQPPGERKALGASLIIVAAAYRFWAEASKARGADVEPLLEAGATKA